MVPIKEMIPILYLKPCSSCCEKCRIGPQAETEKRASHFSQLFLVIGLKMYKIYTHDFYQQKKQLEKKSVAKYYFFKMSFGKSDHYLHCIQPSEL
jgi:hypothetical protein